MRMVRFDSIGGASGDMILASLIGLGVDVALLNTKLNTLNIGRLQIRVEPFASHGLNGLKLVIDCPHEHHHHRGLTEIVSLINASSLNAETKKTAGAIFRRLAEAEGKVHGIHPDKVHFHEVGAIDSIIDIVGICICLETLGTFRVTFSSLPTGHGEIMSQHGVLPIPAPATMELMKGFTMSQVDEPFELLTPTAAAVLTTLWSKPDEDETHTVGATSSSFGSRTLRSRPNLLRATLLDSVSTANTSSDSCVVLECNIDDSTPEVIGALAEKLMENGALDVTLTPLHMKKFRLATMLTVISKPSDATSFIEMILAHSTTFGIREYTCKRHILDRKHETVKTPYGEVRIKLGLRNGKAVTSSPEYEDCLVLAQKHNIPLKTVQQSALNSLTR